MLTAAKLIIRFCISVLLAAVFSLPSSGEPWGALAIQPSGSGWTEFTPTTADTGAYALTDIRQPGTRLIYISSSEGNDTEAELYFWDGAQIIDSSGNRTGKSGKAYGTDPMNPSGPVKPFRRWSYVAPRRDGSDIGTPWDGTPWLAPGGNSARTRYEFPDWWLFKRGDTFILDEDYLSFARETNPEVTENNGGGINVPGGNSVTTMQIVGAYGSDYIERPRLMNPPGGAYISRGDNPAPKHLAYLSLRFDGRTGKREDGFSFLYPPAESVNILFEDCWFDGLVMGGAIQHTSGEYVFRRTLITDSWLPTHEQHVQGIYFYGNRDCILRFEECILMRNGFTHGDPAEAWPPQGEQIYNIFDRNMYLSGECDNMNSGFFDSISLAGASGDQFRCGMRLERSFFYQGYVSVGAHGGYADSDGPTGSIMDNVLLRYDGSGTEDNRGQPGWPFILTSGAYQVEVTRNIVANTQYNTAYPAFQIGPLDWYCYSHTFHYPTRGNTVHDNIFDSGNASAAVRINDGVDSASLDCSGWTYPGVSSNRVENNILINAGMTEWEYRTQTPADGTTNDTLFAGNTLYANRETAALAEGWPDPNRTLKTYLQSLGYGIASADGYPEFFNQAAQQRKGYWRPQFTARALINYFRTGYGMTGLSAATPGDLASAPDFRGQPVIAYPLPARDMVRFLMNLDAESRIRIIIYNAALERVGEVEQTLAAGQGRTLVWHCTHIAAGMYLARILRDGREIQTLKLALQK